MPRHSANILELARRGAEQRYVELKAEIAALVRDFPHLGGRGGRRSSTAAATEEGGASRAGRRRRRRRKMSAAARKAVSERMKKYWASRRSAKQK